MYDLDDYVFPIELEYDKEYLHWVCKNIKHWPMYSADRGKTFFAEFNDIYFPANVEAIRIKNKLLESTTFSFSYVPPGKETGWHVDHTRGCTLICPLDNEPHLIKLRTPDEDVDYYYSQPTLTNAKHRHNGINHTNIERYNLLFHFDEKYDTIKEMAKNNELVFKWKQDYNICQIYDNDILAKYFNTHSDLNDAKIVITDKEEVADSLSCTTIFIGKTNKEYNHNIVCEDKMSVVQAVKQILDSPKKIKKIEFDE